MYSSSFGTSHKKPNESKSKSESLVDKDGFSRQSTVFPWIEQNKDLNVETIQSIGQKTVTMKVRVHNVHTCM